MQQLEEFVATTDEETLSRLAFAVVKEMDATCVLVRLRPHRGAPSAAAWQGVAAGVSQVEELVRAVRAAVVSPLRRDVLQRLLANDPERLTWVEPEGEASFRTLDVAEDAFRPLTDWVDYVLDQDRARLVAWQDTFQFAFEEYEVADARRDVPSPASHPEPARGSSPAPRLADDETVVARTPLPTDGWALIGEPGSLRDLRFPAWRRGLRARSESGPRAPASRRRTSRRCRGCVRHFARSVRCRVTSGVFCGRRRAQVE